MALYFSSSDEGEQLFTILDKNNYIINSYRN